MAIDAVEVAVASVEDSGIFNAGIGSSLTYDKQIEIMFIYFIMNIK